MEVVVINKFISLLSLSISDYASIIISQQSRTYTIDIPTIDFLLIYLTIPFYIQQFSHYYYNIFMEEKLLINRLINSWDTINELQRTILFIGPSHVGRTTSAEMIKKYQFKNPTPGLTLDPKIGYVLDGVISIKSIRVQTIYPSVYEQSNEKEELKILDVPCMILPPENKKWTSLEQRVNMEYLIKKTNKVGFLIFVDEKNTRTNVNTWKKTLLNFLELFKPDTIDENFIKSVGIIITKAPTEMKDDVAVNRLKLLKGALDKQKGNSQIIEQLFKSIIAQNRIFICKKASDDQTEKQSILNLWNQLQKLPNYILRKENMKEIGFTPEGQKWINEYFLQIKDYIKIISKLTKDILRLQEWSRQSVSQFKTKSLQNIKLDGGISKEVKENFEDQTGKAFNYFEFIKQFINIQTEINSKRERDISQLLHDLIKLKFFSSNTDQLLFQTIQEGYKFFSQILGSNPDFTESIDQLKSVFTIQTKRQVLKKLPLAENNNKNKSFYEASIELIDSNFTQIPANLQQFRNRCKKQLIKYSNPKEAVKSYCQDLKKQKDQNKIRILAYDIAKIYIGKGLHYEAGKIYSSANMVSESLSELKKAVQKVADNSIQKPQAYIQVAQTYIKQLADKHLFEEAIRFCYDAASKLEYAYRQKFASLLNNVIQKRSRNSEFTNFLQENIDKGKVSEIIKVAQSKIGQL